jgi:hypothetical protein
VRRIVDIQGLTGVLPLTVNQIYKGVRNPMNPIPHKKYGKRLLFDLEKVFKWFDALPGRDGDGLYNENRNL